MLLHRLRDLSRPESLAFSYFVSPEFDRSWEETNEMVTENAISYIEEDKPDFAFVYLGLTDAAGHGNGWMGEEYMKACSRSLGSRFFTTRFSFAIFTIWSRRS